MRTIARRQGRAGELALREHDGDYGIVSNGVFLMDTSDGRSERELVRRALEAARTPPPRRVLLGGLGVGFSLAETLASTDVEAVVVVEWEPAVVEWNRTITGARTGGSVDDPRVRCEVVDLVAWLHRPADERFDAICLDVDNGPDWTVTDDNRWLYGREGLRALRGRLLDGGALAVWSASAAPAFERLLEDEFGGYRRTDIAVRRGEPDVVYVART